MTVHGPSATHPAGRALRQVAVISDGSGQPGRPVEAALAGDLTTIHDLARVPTLTHVITATDITRFALTIEQLPDTVAAVFVTRTDPHRARAVQCRVEQSGGRPVLIDEDTTAIALTAATSAYLRRIGRDPSGARILIAGASTMPILTPLLISTGFLDITMWNSVDARRFPLLRAARDADVVLDLLPGDPAIAGLAMDRPEGSVISRSALDGRKLAAPGLLRALAEHPAGTFTLDISLYQLCADAIASSATHRHRLPDLQDNRRITDAIATALHQAVKRPEVGSSESRWSWRSRRSP